MDRIFRNKVNEHASEVPSDMWTRIELGMVEDEPKKRFIWLPFLGLGIVGILISAYFLYGSNLINEKHSNEKERSNELPLTIQSDDNQNVDLSVSNTNVENSENLLDAKSDFGKPTGTFQKSIGSINNNNKVRGDFRAIQPNLEKVILKNKEVLIKDSESTLKNMKAGPFQNRIPLIPPAFLNSDFQMLDWNERNFKDPTGCPNFSKTFNPNIFIEAHLNPLYAKSILSSNNPEIGSSYLDLRKNTESALVSWSAGLNVGWISMYNIGLKTGLNYEVINERFEYQDPEAVRNQTIIVIDTIFNSDGTTTINMDTSVVQVNGFEKQRIHNYHKSIDIPIHVLYQIDMERIDFEISGGPNINLKYSNRGKIVDPNNNDQWFTNGQNGSYNVFKDRLSVSFSLSVSALYSINEKIQIYASPNFKIHPNSISLESSPFNQKYANIGIAAGVRYYFYGNPNF